MDDPFPGFSKFSSTIEEVMLLPMSWQNALATVNGVYLLVCPKTGEGGGLSRPIAAQLNGMFR